MCKYSMLLLRSKAHVLETDKVGRKRDLHFNLFGAEEFKGMCPEAVKTCLVGLYWRSRERRR